MKYIVAVRDEKNTVQFSFDTESERERFIELTQKERPDAQFVRSELDKRGILYPLQQSA